MKMANTVSEKDAFERLPIHLQQALLIASNILQRISEKRLDKPDKGGLVSVVPTPYGDDNEA